MATGKCRVRTQLNTFAERCNLSQFGLALQYVILFCRYRYKSQDSAHKSNKRNKKLFHQSSQSRQLFFYETVTLPTGESEII